MRSASSGHIICLRIERVTLAWQTAFEMHVNDFVGRLARQVALTDNVVWVLIAVALALAVGSVARMTWLLLPNTSATVRRQRLKSLATWWALFVTLLLVALAGQGAAIAIFAVLSVLGLLEFRALVQQRIAHLRLWWTLACLSVPVHYLLIGFGCLDALPMFIPIWVLCILLLRIVFAGRISGFLETAGITFLGLMVIVFLFSHAVLLFTLPAELNPAGGAFGLFLFLVLLTEFNDIAQSLWGRLLGHRKIAPVISPNKTWEGFLLGAATTVAIGAVLANFLTPFSDRSLHSSSASWAMPTVPTLAAGLLIAVGGALGDMTMAAVKRQAGVKDSSALLPGQGGVLDRINSLTFTGPLFFYFTHLLYGRTY